MPRGTKGKPASSQKRIARRNPNSTSRIRQINAGSAIVGPRRSARIAGSSPHRTNNPAPEPDIMFDVARRGYLSSHSRSFESGISHQRTRERSTRTRLRQQDERLSPPTASRQRHSPTRRTEVTANSSTGYALEFVVAPPSEVQVGSPINHAVTLQVRAVQPQLRSPGLDDTLHQYFAVATLIQSEDNAAAAAAPRGTLTGPQLADSVHAPQSVYSEVVDASVMGYISFPYLAVLTPGAYRVRITLMRIGTPGSGNQSAITLHTVDSGQIQVTEPL